MTISTIPKTPIEDRAVAAAPPLAEWAEATEQNRSATAERRFTVARVPFAEFRERTRHSLFTAIDSSNPASNDRDRPIVATGHQCDPFHAGVWIKNSAAFRLAERIGGYGLHLAVDNDAAPGPQIATPAGSPERPFGAFEPYDAPSKLRSSISFEESLIVDENLFASFGERVASRLRPFGFEPLVENLWHDVVARTDLRTAGERFSYGRRTFERSIGIDNLELTVGRLADETTFSRWAAELALDARRFADAHNRALALYVRKFGGRSKRSPAPALEVTADRIETPFWIWSTDSPRRERLFVSLVGDRVLVSAGDIPAFDASRGDFERLIDGRLRFADLSNWKIRPRALSLTLFARLFVADLFVHGIGGALYDRATDLIVESYYGVAAPRYVAVTGTYRLPVPLRPGVEDEAVRLERSRRYGYWNPESALPEDLIEREPIAGWIEEKHSLIGEHPGDRLARRDRFQRLRELNDRLRPYAAGELRERLERRERMASTLEALPILRSREYPYFFHPKSTLVDADRSIAERLVSSR